MFWYFCNTAKLNTREFIDNTDFAKVSTREKMYKYSNEFTANKICFIKDDIYSYIYQLNGEQVKEISVVAGSRTDNLHIDSGSI